MLRYPLLNLLKPIGLTPDYREEIDWHIHLGHDVQSSALPHDILPVLVCPYLSRVMPEQLMWHLSEYFTFLSEPQRDNQMPPVSRDIDWPLIDHHTSSFSLANINILMGFCRGVV